MPGKWADNFKAQSSPVLSQQLSEKRAVTIGYLLPFFPAAIERFDLSDFDLVISSSHCVAKGVVVPPTRDPHLLLLHADAIRWDRYGDYFGGDWKEWRFFPSSTI